MFGCNNDRLFPEKYTLKDHISNTKLEKGDHYYNPLLQSYSKKKCPEKRSKIQTKCAQYGHRIGKKVYWNCYVCLLVA